jgi:hypothetical protein
LTEAAVTPLRAAASFFEQFINAFPISAQLTVKAGKALIICHLPDLIFAAWKFDDPKYRKQSGRRIDHAVGGVRCGRTHLSAARLPRARALASCVAVG